MPCSSLLRPGLRRRIIRAGPARAGAVGKKKPKASLPWAESTVEEVEETIGAARIGHGIPESQPLEASLGSFLLQCNIA